MQEDLFLPLEKNLVVVSVDQPLLRVQQEHLFLPLEKNLVVVSVDQPWKVVLVVGRLVVLNQDPAQQVLMDW